jgi:hypothetical protein
MVRLTISLLVAACTFRPEPLPSGTTDGGRVVADASVPTADVNPLAPDAFHPDAPRRAADAHPGPDAKLPDAAQPDAAPAASVFGSNCPSTACTTAGGYCLSTGNGWPADGYCTKLCLGNSDCGAGAFCSAAISGMKYCVRDCTPSGGCVASDQACGEWLYGIDDLGQPACTPGNTTAQDGDPCTTFADCNDDAYCYSNPFDDPGGYCAELHCSIGDPAACPHGDATCFAAGSIGACWDTCTRKQDCRTNWACSMATTPGQCIWVHKAPGDACVMDSDCGMAPWQCLTGTSYPGGYCGSSTCTKDSDCPAGAVCYDPNPAVTGDEWCAKTCTSDNDCRQPDYACWPTTTPSVNVCR